jgi:hypothetical protein
VHILDRVNGGERFTCREFTTVLSQALNARGIPARSVALLRSHHHAGYGRVHAVSEAWIDDLDRWVVLDGQNGMYWVDSEDAPLGLVELRHRRRTGQRRPDIVSLAGKSSALADTWWPYFHTVNPTGVMISPAPYAPLFEGIHVQQCDQLRRDPVGAHPDLLELGIGISDLAGRPAIQPVTRHAHALGFEVVLDSQRWTLPLAGGAWPITATIGEHTATIATVTNYGAHRPHAVRYVVRR